MRRTMAWSYDLLKPVEQLVFDRCAVFFGVFSRRAAMAICGDGIDASDFDDVIDSLIDKSLITTRGF